MKNYLQTLCVSLVVILRQIVAELVDSCRLDTLYALSCSIQLNFAADWKQLLTSYPAGLKAPVGNKALKFGEPRLNRSQEILPKLVRDDIFDGYLSR